MHEHRRGVLKSAPGHNKALPDLPLSPPLTLEENTRHESFLPATYVMLSPSPKFHPRRRSAGGRFDVNDSSQHGRWTVTTGHNATDSASATPNSKHKPPRSMHMRGSRVHSSRSSRSASIGKKHHVYPRRRGATPGYHSSSTTPSRTSSIQSHARYGSHYSRSRHTFEVTKPVEGLKLNKWKTLITNAVPTSSQSQLLKGNASPSSLSKSTMKSSPLLVSSTKSNLRRRQRVMKKGSMSETDPDPQTLSSFFVPSHRKESTTRRSKTSHHRAEAEASHSIDRVSRHPSSYRPLIPSPPVTVYSLPLILPANAAYECRVEWESDRAGETENEAGNLWKRLEKEYGLSPIPDLSPLTLGGRYDDADGTPRRGRWKVKVMETPTIPSGALGEDASMTDERLVFGEQNGASEDQGHMFSESAMGVVDDDDGIPVLRELSLTELLPSLSAYTYLSALLKKRFPSRHKHRTKARQSRTIMHLSRSKTRLPRVGGGPVAFHRDVKRALQEVWEGYDNGAMAWSGAGESAWSSHLAALVGQRDSTASRSGMGDSITGTGSDQSTREEERLVMGHRPGAPGLGIAMRRCRKMESQSSTGADSVIDLYVGI